MPTKRRRKTHTAVTQITERAIELFLAKDWAELHRELKRKPWEAVVEWPMTDRPIHGNSELQVRDAKEAYEIAVELNRLARASGRIL